MTKPSDTDVISARISAGHAAESLVAAYWVEEDRKAFHMKSATDELKKAVEKLGYNMLKKEKEKEKENELDNV